MKKRIASVLLALVLFVCVLPGAAMAAGELSGFVRVNTYRSGLFSDVAPSAWYAAYVEAAYEYGLMAGTSGSEFSPDAVLTVAEAVKLAACLHSVYGTGSSGSLSGGTPWYKASAEYALKNGLIAAEPKDYGASATRSEFAVLLSKALPAEALSARNSVPDNAIPDVPAAFSYAPAVYELYRAGVLTGSDAQGRFLPNNAVTRAEVAAIATRMVNASYRQSFTLTPDLTTEKIYNMCAPAIFYVEITDIKGTKIKSGSGFFIDPSGIAVTNFHVLNGGAQAAIVMNDGKKYDVVGIYDYSKGKDLALIKVKGDHFPYLTVGDSSAIATGADAWAIGSPLGFKNTISRGIISCASRTVEDSIYIQTTAAISSGSSGGALLDGAGRVIGVTTATAEGAQNLNLAVPISVLKDFKRESLVTLQSILPNTKYYANNYPVPDFGIYAGAAAYTVLSDTYNYRVSDLPKRVDDILRGYGDLLEDNTFQVYSYAVEAGGIATYYLNSAYRKLVKIYKVTTSNVDYIRIVIMEI